MQSVITGFIATTVPLLMYGIASWTRWRLVGGIATVLIAISAAFGLGVMGFSDLWVVPVGIGMDQTLILLALWVVFGAVARTAGPLNIPGPPLLVSMIMGATLGEVPAAAILGASARDAKGGARLALAAAGGGMIGRVGDPALLVLTESRPDLLVFLAPLGLLCALLARPRKEDLIVGDEQNRTRTLLVAAVALLALVPGMAPYALGVGIIGLGALASDRRGPIEIGGSLWNVGAIVLGIIAIVGGGVEQAAVGLEWGQELGGMWGAPALTLVVAILTALTDATAMSVIGQGIVDRALSLDSMAVVPAMAAGIAVGGLAPLIAARALRAGWKLWLGQVGLAI
ncbi:MAG: hypothetical protein CL930_07690, partial [Deltaproteobacteria bacterium]|nr:hypothetical protein [Deltaproteobacteria bacterium]